MYDAYGELLTPRQHRLLRLFEFAPAPRTLAERRSSDHD